MPYIGKKPADIIATAVDTTTGTFSGDIDASTVNATGDTAAGDNAAIGFTSAEGLILTGQGSTSDITVKNDADATVFTVPTGTDDILFPDNAKAMFGAGSDLQIYHTGAHSLISEQGTGSLILLTNQLDINNAGNSENMITATSDGAVSLFHDNSKKLETTSSGFKSTGAGSVSINLGSTNAGGVQIVLDGDSDGDFTGSDYSYIRHETDGRIDFVQDSPSGTNEIRFYTETLERFRLTNSAAVFNEAGNNVDFRVESDGNANMFVVDAGQNNVGIGTSPTSTRILHVQSNTAAYFNTMIDHASSSDNVYALDLFFSGQSPDNNTSEFVRCRDTGQVRLVIDSDGDITNHDNSYGAISDEKLKEQIADASSQWDDIKALKVRKFKMKEDVSTKGDSDEHWRLGVVAQEVETAGMNGLIKNKKDLDPDTNEELGTTTKTVKYSILYMKAVKALQEAMARIETLEAKVTALEGA